MIDDLDLILDFSDKRTRDAVWWAKVGVSQTVQLRLESKPNEAACKGRGALETGGGYVITWTDVVDGNFSYTYQHGDLREYLQSKWEDYTLPSHKPLLK